MARPNFTISGMATPTTWLSPRKLVTRICLAGFAIVVNVLVAVAGLPSSPVAVTVAVYVCPYSRAADGSQLPPSAASVPSTTLPAASFSSTVVSCASFVVKVMAVDAGTSLASAAGSLMVAAAFGAFSPPSPPPCQLDGLSPPPLVQAVRAIAAASSPAASARRRPTRRALTPRIGSSWPARMTPSQGDAVPRRLRSDAPERVRVAGRETEHPARV